MMKDGVVKLKDFKETVTKSRVIRTGLLVYFLVGIALSDDTVFTGSCTRSSTNPKTDVRLAECNITAYRLSVSNLINYDIIIIGLFNLLIIIIIMFNLLFMIYTLTQFIERYRSVQFYY